MPRVVNCPDQSESCFLKSPAGVEARFCQECGASSATVVTETKPECVKCGHQLDDMARFCSECGTKVARNRVSELLANHVPPSQRGGVSTGRGLTAAEMAQMEASIRAPSKVSDPTREYEVDSEHQKIMGIAVPEAGNKAVELAKGRTAIRARDGEHTPGALSSDAKIPTNYHEGVKVIPYNFKNPARRGSEVVQDSRGGSKIAALSDADADAFFSDDPDPFFQDDPPPRAPRAKAASKKPTAAAKIEALRTAAPPADPKKCHECGRFLGLSGECPHCLDPARLEDLWRTDD